MKGGRVFRKMGIKEVVERATNVPRIITSLKDDSTVPYHCRLNLDLKSDLVKKNMISEQKLLSCYIFNLLCFNLQMRVVIAHRGVKSESTTLD